MVLCLLTLPIFAVLAIFSVKYRKLTKDAFECLFKTVTLRKCESGLDDKIRSDISGTVLRFSPKAGGFVYRHYKILSWIVLILFIFGTYGTIVGSYNYIQYGNCNGPESTGICLLDPTGSNSKLSEIDTEEIVNIKIPEIEDNDPIIGNKDAELTIIEFGCYRCPYTKKAESVVQEVLEYYDGKVNLQFKNFIIPSHNLSYEAALAANCAMDQDKYKEYHDKLFELQETIELDSFSNIAEQLSLNKSEFEKCFSEEKYKEEIEADFEAGIKAGVSGTPTFFINDQKIVGPKPFRTFKTIIKKELK